MRIDAGGSEDHLLTGNRVGRRTGGQPRGDAFHRAGVSRLTPADDLAVLDSHVCLDDTDGCIDDDHVGDHEVEGTVDAARLRILAHAVAQRLAAAVDRLVSDGSKIFLDLDVQVGIAQPDLVTRGDPEQT